MELAPEVSSGFPRAGDARDARRSHRGRRKRRRFGDDLVNRGGSIAAERRDRGEQREEREAGSAHADGTTPATRSLAGTNLRSSLDKSTHGLSINPPTRAGNGGRARRAF